MSKEAANTLLRAGVNLRRLYSLGHLEIADAGWGFIDEAGGAHGRQTRAPFCRKKEENHSARKEKLQCGVAPLGWGGMGIPTITGRFRFA